MPEYQLEIKQVVDYPRCRIYRQFIQTLMEDRNIRTGGGSGLFYYTVLCSYANFRTSYRRIDGISYTVYPGEWICSVKELTKWFRTRFQHQAVSILEELQKNQLISYLILDRGKVIKYKVRDWKKHNTILDYNCPCQKKNGFFFLPVSTAAELISAKTCSEMDIVLDLWISTIYNDKQVQGSKIGPVVYLRNGTGNPLVTYSELSARWGMSKATVGRILKKLDKQEYLSLMSFPGRCGSVIYLQNYLSTMFQISDIMIDKEEVAMELNIKLELAQEEKFGTKTVPNIELMSTKADKRCENAKEEAVSEEQISVSESVSCVSKPCMKLIIKKVAGILSVQGISCFECPKTKYKLYPLSNACGEDIILRGREPVTRNRIGLDVICENGKTVYTFELTLTRCREKSEEEA